ncbi:MAG: translation elongation factor Ts [Burkholderiales bacterium]
MAEITAGLVKELRERTGLGMMECKRALEETGGDLARAEDLLRVKSGAKASKAAGRIASEGVIGAYLSPERKLGALVEVNCETDFVAKNPDFLGFARALAEVVARENPADVAALSKLAIAGENIEARRQALVQKIGENLAIRRFARAQTAGRLVQYLHGVKIGVMVDYEGDDEIAKGVAMHVAFAKPQFLSQADVAQDVVARERAVQEARARESGKPPEIAAKMVEGALNKFLAESSLLGQPFVMNDKLTVEKALAEKKTRVAGYRFLVVGEGIEKKSSDFAAEVMAQAGAGR